MKEIVVFSTTGTLDEAERIATALVERNLAACCNLVPQVRSLFKWEGELRNEEETLLIIKSQEQKFPELLAAIRSLHSYEIPEVISIPLSGGSEEYLDWIRRSLSPGKP